MGALNDIRAYWAERGVELQAYERHNGDIVLSLVKTDEEKRGRGLARAAMTDLLSYADENARTVALTPSNDFGASKNGLTRWYASLGFVSNKGRNKDYRISESMHRSPRGSGGTHGRTPSRLRNAKGTRPE